MYISHLRRIYLVYKMFILQKCQKSLISFFLLILINSKRNPSKFWGYFAHLQNMYNDADPHDGYSMLKNIVNLPRIKDYFIVTTNNDGMFERAGFASEKIWEFHGNIYNFQNEEDGVYEIEDYSFFLYLHHLFNLQKQSGKFLTMKKKWKQKNLFPRTGPIYNYLTIMSLIQKGILYKDQIIIIFITRQKISNIQVFSFLNGFLRDESCCVIELGIPPDNQLRLFSENFAMKPNVTFLSYLYFDNISISLIRVNTLDAFAPFTNEFYIDFAYDYKNFAPLAMSCEQGCDFIEEQFLKMKWQ